MGEETNTNWASLPEDIRNAISVAWRYGMPPSASALYGRWWQFESWLRSVVYIELRATHGPKWADHLPKHAEKRLRGDGVFQYMATPDAQALLAYTDVAGLFEIIDANWSLFESTLLEKTVWAGRTVELRNIRNRIGHCRRPHADDLSRIEQTLRDLEGGAFRAVAAFNRQWHVPEQWNDPIVDAWVKRHNTAAPGLIEHAQRQYETSFDLYYSRRPWAPSTSPARSGTQGCIWHARWHMRARDLDLRRFWEDDAMDGFRDTVLLVCARTPRSIDISFSALEDPETIATAIDVAFDLLLYHQVRGGTLLEDYKRWGEINAGIDPRVQTNSVWPIVEDSTRPISIFGA